MIDALFQVMSEEMARRYLNQVPEESAFEDNELSSMDMSSDQGSILQNSASAENFLDKFIFKFWTIFLPKYNMFIVI
jgi:hypothetical protein